MRYMATFYGVVSGGRLSLTYPHLAEQFIASFPDGTAVELVIRKQSASKTKEQLAYYFACLVKKPSEELGYGIRPDGRYELDVLFRNMFLTQNSGTEDEYVKELSDLTIDEMSTYIDHCIQTLAEIGYAAEPPDQNWKLKHRETTK